MRPHILLLTTGGTIASLPTAEGLAPGLDGEALAGLLPQGIMDCYDITIRDILHLDSSNIQPEEWQTIARHVFENRMEYSGIVITHGTDTMAYTASALSFMLENLQKPVIFTGSQIPLCRMRSDGRDNLITSLLIAAQGRAAEVCLYFGSKLLRGNRAVKRSADGLEAFYSPNWPPLATAGVNIQYDAGALAKPKATGELTLAAFEPVPIGVLKVFPGIQFELFESILTERLRGIVLETFGAGNIPDNGKSTLLPLIQRAYKSGTVLTVCSQCAQGSVHLGTYATSAALKDAGAVSGQDMTTEAAVAKLYYLFSKGYELEEIKRKVEENLRGEIS